jgi:hypothetical protein
MGDVGAESEDEAGDWDRNHHRVERMTGDLRRASRIIAVHRASTLLRLLPAERLAT